MISLTNIISEKVVKNKKAHIEDGVYEENIKGISIIDYKMVKIWNVESNFRL